MHCSGSSVVHWAGWRKLPQNLKNTNKQTNKNPWFPCPSAFPKLRFISGRPKGKTTKLRAMAAQAHSPVSVEIFPTKIWTLFGKEAETTSGNLALYLKSPLGKDKVSFISHFNTMEGHPNDDFHYNYLLHNHNVFQLQHSPIGKGMKFFHNSEVS